MPPQIGSAVRIGGHFSLMLFSKQYLELAERGLRDRAEDVVLSVVYVQRHCLELIVKDLILACFHVYELQLVTGEAASQVKPPDWEHEFKKLVPSLKSAINAIGYGAPNEIEALALLAQKYVDLENGSRERFRYAHVEKFQTNKAPPHSFESPLEIPVHDLQQSLRDVYRRCADIDNERSLLMQLYDECTAQFQKAVSLGKIDLGDL
jgi:hypothetical protein